MTFSHKKFNLTSYFNNKHFDAVVLNTSALGARDRWFESIPRQHYVEVGKWTKPRKNISILFFSK